MADNNRRAMIQRIAGAFAAFAVVLVVGVAGFVWLGQGQWSWFDSLYMTVITLSTVGFGETLPGLEQVSGARALTLGLILAGSGVMLYLTSSVIAFIVEGDLRGALKRGRMDRVIQRLRGHIIVCGCGATGSSVVTALLAQGRQVVVLESDEAKVIRLRSELGVDVPYLLGDATADALLKYAGIEHAMGLVAALSDDRDDLFLVFTARDLNPNLRIVAKTVDPANASKMERAGADFVVSPASLGGLRLASAIHRPSVLRFLDAMGTNTVDPHHIDEVQLGANSPVLGKALASSGIRECASLVLAIRGEDGKYVYNPPINTVLVEGMTLILLVRLEQHPDLLELLGAA